MKRTPLIFLVLIMMFSLCSCAKQELELADMTTEVNDSYAAIVWGERTYVPYCAISKSGCGTQIGIVNGDKDDRVYEYEGYSADNWIINAYVMDSAMLYREINVTDIPDGLDSEYEWNN